MKKNIVDFETEYLIIGSGIAGYNALKEIINSKPNSKVTMITADKYYPYDRPPLSKDYLKGKMQMEELFFEPEEFYKRENLKIILNIPVNKINTKDKVIEINGDYIKFKKALIATGGRPRKLNLPGENMDKVFYLRTLGDCNNIKDAIKNASTATIIGGGFIGVEVASSLITLGVKTTIIEALPYIWSSFVDEKISRFMQQYLENNGITFILNDSGKEIINKGNKRVLVTNSGKNIESDIILIAVGIVPNTEIAQQSGIEVSNGILVNEYLETNQKDIYAAGDVANILDPVSKKRKRIEHWNNAEYTGKLAAKNMMDENQKYNFISSVWSDIFDLHIESAGETREYDEYIIRGKLELQKPSFSIIYVKGGLIKGYLAINRKSVELLALNKLILNNVDVSKKQKEIEDLTFNLNKLL
ncbi:NAD(P)/FAD-dependent oxidoreductase [Acidianus manzaensis]|uniref:Pyridine nucleotide-disulfide oxidoreductase n=1 Tax=Acidianus manzaensis TaxID=282676 RepID=A0A1W6JWR8_9CREN|nr:FAD-dependent oxidoreductase [Acidianus manzaensis]ARM74697.1 pyridine nucleotide-disulfide oxidoreductase [Acidianus manzaensis]